MTEQWAGLLWQRFKDCYGQKWTSLFQGPEAIQSWRITWADIDATADQIKYALSRIGTDYPEWPPTFGQFKGLCGAMPVPALLAPKVVYLRPNDERLAELRIALSKIGKKTGPYWTPDKVVNSSQVNFIVMQAAHFGHLSIAHRFLQDCKAAGVITEDNRLAKRA